MSSAMYSDWTDDGNGRWVEKVGGEGRCKACMRGRMKSSGVQGMELFF